MEVSDPEADNIMGARAMARTAKQRYDKVVRRAAAAVAYPFRVNKGTLRVTIPARLPVIEGDVDGLQAAVMNLLSNALKYSTTTRRVDLSVRRTQGRIAIRVSDQGIGIAADQLPRIFDQFYRVRDGRASQVGGMGLGLSLVRHVVEAHHGTIDVQSVVGKGSTFTILLPVSTPIRREA